MDVNYLEGKAKVNWNKKLDEDIILYTKISKIDENIYHKTKEINEDLYMFLDREYYMQYLLN